MDQHGDGGADDRADQHRGGRGVHSRSNHQIVSVIHPSVKTITSAPKNRVTTNESGSTALTNMIMTANATRVITNFTMQPRIRMRKECP
ncbi:MAG: hypothetical protein ACRDTC_21825 [Pseudonocardiaceae bacterium]